MAKTDVLQGGPMEPGSGRYWVDNLTNGSLNFPNVKRMTCTCRHAEIYPTNPRCKHLAYACQLEERRLELLRRMPIKAARATEEVTGEKQVPVIAGIPQDELKAVFA